MSKKNRRSKSRKERSSSQKNKRRSSQPDVSSIAIPDRRVMESMMQQMFSDGDVAEDSLEAAQQIMYDAFEAESSGRQVQLAKQALERSPDCADAYVLLAEHARSLDEALHFYEQGVAAGTRALGDDGFQEFEGHFWGFLPTRPYMRARAGLADALWASGRYEDAVGNYQALLRLNPNDNQGIRYRLASALLDLQRHDELFELLEQYKEDDMADWSYTRALLAFRQEGESASACRLLREAYKSNSHVPDHLTGAKPMPQELPDHISPGRENEAISYAAQYLPAWKNSPGAITWLQKTLRVKLAEPPQRAAPSWSRVKQVLSDLPQSDDVWEVELASLGDSHDGKLWMMVIANATSGEVLLLDMMDQRPKDTEVWQQMLQVMRQPETGEPSRPTQVQVTRKTFCRLWQPKLAQVKIDCEVVDALPLVDSVMTLAGSSTDMLERIRIPSDSAEGYPDISSLPQSVGEVWQADVRQLASWIEVDGQPQRPWIILVANTTDGLIYTTDLTQSTPPPNWLWQGVQKAICQPAVGSPHLPGVIEVSSDEDRRILATYLEEAGVKCVVAGQLEQLDEMLAGLTDRLAGSSGPKPLVDSPGVTEETLGKFFRAAADFYRQTPWRSIAGDTIIQVESDALTSGPWFAVIMGQSGMSLGLALYEDLDLLCRLITGDASDEENARRTSALSLTYGEAFELAGKDIDALERHGWPIAGPEAYPTVMRVNPGLAIRVPLKWELELLCGCLECIPKFLKDEQAYATSSAQRPLNLKLSVVSQA